MINRDSNPDLSVAAGLVAIAAFLDGELVDAVALKNALAGEAGREYLVDLLRLRQAVPQVWPAEVAPGSSHRHASRRWWAAAAVVLIASALSYAAGQRAQGAGNQLAGASVVAVLEAAPAPAPEPTHVIRLEPGVTWHVEGAR